MKGIFIVGFTGYIGKNILARVRNEGLDTAVQIGGFNRKGYKKNLGEDDQATIEITKALLDFSSELEAICILNVVGTTSCAHSPKSISEYVALNAQINSFLLNSWSDATNRKPCLYILPNSVGIFGLSPAESTFTISSMLKPYNIYTKAKACC